MVLLSRYSFIDQLGPLLGAIVKIVGGVPVAYFYRAEVRLKGDQTTAPGVLEFMIIEWIVPTRSLL